VTTARQARERFNAIRDGEATDAKPEPKAEPEPAGPSSVVVGTPGWREQLEAWGMISAFGDDDDAWTKRIRGY